MGSFYLIMFGLPAAIIVLAVVLARSSARVSAPSEDRE